MAKNFVEKKGGASYGLQNEDRRIYNAPGDLPHPRFAKQDFFTKSEA